jgi:hypothetical protein
MKKFLMLSVLAIVGMSVTSCASGYRQDSKAEVYTKSSFIGNDTPRQVQTPVQQQQLQYPVAE